MYATGDRFNDFEVISRLGKGTYGTVYACRWAMDEREYAVKVLDGPIEGAQREFIALQSVQHPNIVRCIHAGSIVGGGWYLQCELVNGTPLSDRVRQGERFDAAVAVDITSQMLTALEAIHPDVDRILELKAKGGTDGLSADEFGLLAELEESGIVHRDIKPENTIVTDDGRVVIVDFGISSPAGSTMRTGSATQEYLPPDFAFLAGDRWRPDIDLYAVGVVAYEMLCGRHPYIGSEWGSDPRTPPEDLSSPLVSWLMRACAARQADRFPSASAMRSALLKAAAIEPDVVDAEPDAASGHDVDEFSPLPYEEWAVRRVDPTSNEELLDLVLEIVSVEGPIICGRLYELVSAALGSSVERSRSRLNSLVYGAVRNGRLKQVEPLGNGQIDKTVMLPDLECIVPRMLGPRSAWQYPKVEMVELVRSLIDELDVEDFEYFHDAEFTALVVRTVLGVADGTWEARYLEQSTIEAYLELFPDGGEATAATPAEVHDGPRFDAEEDGTPPSRAAEIQEDLDTHFIELVGVAVATPDPDTWRSLVEGLGVQASFGWSWPIAHDDPPILVPFCPEIIDEQTRDLTDEELNDYLNVIKFVLDGHIIRWIEQPDALERQRDIEEQLYNEYPQSLEAWNRVQLSVLDRGAF